MWILAFHFSTSSTDVAFDILFEGEGSVIHQSLRERKALLRKSVRPVKGRLELLLPDDSMNSMRSAGISTP